MIREVKGGRKIHVTLGGDKNYDTGDFVDRMREAGVTPHVAQNDTNNVPRVIFLAAGATVGTGLTTEVVAADPLSISGFSPGWCMHHSVDQREYVFDRCGLPQEVIVRGFRRQVPQVLVVVPGYEYERYVPGVCECPDETVEPDTVQCRHEHIGDYQVNLLTFQGFPGLFSVLRRDDIMSLPSENFNHGVQEAFIVVHK